MAESIKSSKIAIRKSSEGSTKLPAAAAKVIESIHRVLTISSVVDTN